MFAKVHQGQTSSGCFRTSHGHARMAGIMHACGTETHAVVWSPGQLSHRFVNGNTDGLLIFCRFALATSQSPSLAVCVECSDTTDFEGLLRGFLTIPTPHHALSSAKAGLLLRPQPMWRAPSAHIRIVISSATSVKELQTSKFNSFTIKVCQSLAYRIAQQTTLCSS